MAQNEPGNPPYLRDAVLSLQRSELQRELPSFKPRCASGTWYTTGEEIHEAVRRQQHAALLAYPDKVRRARTDCEWAEMYRDAMIAKRFAVALDAIVAELNSARMAA